MKRGRWFLPDTPDVLGMLRRQAEVTVEGMEALAAWAQGDAAAADRIREREHEADDCKRDLRQALSVSFMTPLEPEDLFELSRDLDEVLNSAKNAVREAEVMNVAADGPSLEMARELADGTRQVATAFAALGSDGISAATDAADRAIKSQRNVERIYRGAMSALLDVDDLREVSARRELYRRLVRASDHLAGVAERVWYSVLKES